MTYIPSSEYDKVWYRQPDARMDFNLEAGDEVVALWWMEGCYRLTLKPIGKTEEDDMGLGMVYDGKRWDIGQAHHIILVTN